VRIDRKARGAGRGDDLEFDGYGTCGRDGGRGQAGQSARLDAEGRGEERSDAVVTAGWG